MYCCSIGYSLSLGAPIGVGGPRSEPIVVTPLVYLLFCYVFLAKFNKQINIKNNLGEIPVISGGPFIDMTAPNVGNNFGLGIDDSCGTMDGARGGIGAERSVLLVVFAEDSRLLLES